MKFTDEQFRTGDDRYCVEIIKGYHEIAFHQVRLSRKFSESDIKTLNVSKQARDFKGTAFQAQAAETAEALKVRRLLKLECWE